MLCRQQRSGRRWRRCLGNKAASSFEPLAASPKRRPTERWAVSFREPERICRGGILMGSINRHLARAENFAAQLGIRLPVLLAPMAGACPPSLSIAVANAGGMGACGALLMKPEEIAAWGAEFRARSQGEFQINLWIPAPAPKRDAELERRQREYLAKWDRRFRRQRQLVCSRTLKRSAQRCSKRGRRRFHRSWGCTHRILSRR